MANTDFSQTKHLDRWNQQGVQFIFGFDACKGLVQRAEDLEESAWTLLKRKRKHEVKTAPRRRRPNVREQIVKERGYENIVLCSEEIAELEYRPGACKQAYRMIVLRNTLRVEKGELELFDQVRYFFYITNDRESSARQIVFLANQRCNQENLIDQLKNGIPALHSPVDVLESNWAYIVIASLAWTLRAWFALLLPEKGRWKEQHRAEKLAILKMEFKAFLNYFIRIPVQLVQTGRRLVYRILSWNRWLHVFFRAVDTLHSKLQC